MTIRPNDRQRAAPRRFTARRAAFTLLEMLAALVLCGMLMLGIGQVLRSAMVQSRTAETAARNLPALRRLGQQLERDLTNARGWRIGDNLMELDGFGGTNPITRTGNLSAALVRYRLIPAAGETWLVRDEQRRRRPGREGISSDALFAGIGRFQVRGVGPDSDARVTRNGFPTIPEVVEVVLFDVDGNPVWSHRVVHHSEVQP